MDTPPDPSLRNTTPTSSSSIHPALVQTEPYVNATHIELFYYIIENGEWSFGDDYLKESRPHVVKYAFTYPFLLNELLAISALHLSARRPAQKSFYREEAARLQSQALRMFNETLRDLNHQNIIPAFLFSALQGIVTFFETFHNPTYEVNDWITFFENIIQSITLLQGVRAIVEPWWQFLITSDIKDICEEPAPPDEEWSDEAVEQLEAVRVRISQSTGLDQTQAVVCDKAIHEMIFVYKSVFGPGSKWLPHDQVYGKYATRWLILVPPAYTELLVQRKPEALLILGYFAVILHKLRDCWNVGDAGQKLIQVVEAHLEVPWDDKLSWLKSYVEGN
jgi:hypothetical protein